MAAISLLVADVDGALVTEQKLSTERARSALLALRERGIRFAVTSGRPPRGMAMLTEALQLDTPIAGFNGGALVNPDLSVIETRSLAPQATRAAIELMRGRGMDVWLYTAAEWQVRDAGAPHVTRESWTVKFEPRVVAEFSDARPFALVRPA